MSITQCFALDALRRITEAWTNTGEACAATPSASVVGGQDPYWTSYAYDAVGNRTTESQHQTASGPTADTTRTYQAPPAGKHSLPKVTQTGINPHEENFTYDAAGNTATRKAGTADIQNLVWDDEGHLKEVTQGTKTSSYLYDTEGQRLIRKDSTGTTLYLPGGNELHTDKVGLATGTRYYSAGNSSLAMRTGTQLTFTLTDHHNTTTTQVTADTALAVTRRKTTIFGAPRGTQPTTWKGDRTFVGGTKDTDTGLTHLGAREYDPTVGRFISVDPIMDLADAQQMHGYTYGNNNPVVISDAWEAAREAGVVQLGSTDLFPGHEAVDLPDEEVWGQFYSSRRSSTSERSALVAAAAEVAGIRPTKALEVKENPTALKVAIIADQRTAEAAKQALEVRAAEARKTERVEYIRRVAHDGKAKSPAGLAVDLPAQAKAEAASYVAVVQDEKATPEAVAEAYEAVQALIAETVTADPEISIREQRTRFTKAITTTVKSIESIDPDDLVAVADDDLRAAVAAVQKQINDLADLISRP